MFLLLLEFERGSIAGYVTDGKFKKRQKDRAEEIAPYSYYTKLVKLFFRHYEYQTKIWIFPY